MRFIKLNFFKSKKFRLFLTVWIIYIFYLQMFGSSHMANSQSALTAAIVNEGRFEIDTYHRAVAQGNAFYNGHYYSGQAPGISFISVPLYLISKPLIYILPQQIVDSLFEKLEKYGGILPPDFEGKKKIPSNYFPDLNKRQILEYVLISGFILPIFTTALFSAIGVILVYSILGRFTHNEGLRMLITLFYAFGTILFPLSTEFFERPIAIVLTFAAFIILFKIRHKELEPKGVTLFGSGLLAGLATMFDYFHLFAAGLLFIYLLSFYIKGKRIKVKKGNKRFWIFELNKQKLWLLLSFIIGVSLSIFPLLLYQYIIFDNPFATSYTYREFELSVYRVSGISNFALPDMTAFFLMLNFIMYSPIIILALYGVYKAFLKRDEYYHDVLAIGIFIIFTFAYASILIFSFSSYPLIAESFKRYMTPILPFSFIFLPYIFSNKNKMKNRMKTLLIVLGVISIFFSWTSAQFGGHQGLGHFNLEDKKFEVIPQFLENGPSSDFLSTLSSIFGGNALLFNFIGLVVLALIILLIWKVLPNKKMDRKGGIFV